MLMFTVPVVALLLAAAITDIRSRKIPNAFPVGMVIMFFAAAIALPQVEWLAATGVALAVFVIGAILFAAGKVGGGDVKLLAATALWAGVSGLLPLLIVTALAGGVLAIMHVAPQLFDYLRAKVWSGASATDPTQPSTLPYGVAIAIGGTFTLAIQVFPT